ncbi:MAG: 23S rRNA (adenine(2030)-N(6))-methyltransferase RlmJ [Lautropia sp.]
MLSYRHGFHAGNHADVLKHFVLVRVLRHLAAKARGFSYIDTHAGAGRYRLTDAAALKNAEFESGIARLSSADDVPAPLDDLLGQVRAYNLAQHGDAGRLQGYPGSPQLALQLLREQDRIRCFERHTTEIGVLQANLAGAPRRATAVLADGFDALRSVLPPPTRRGVVLIDPSYEDKRDYARVCEALADALTRFATGTYLVWYPLVQRREAVRLPGALRRLPVGDWLDVSLTVRAPAEDGYGLHGSGVFAINPPWTLAAELRAVMPWLARRLAQDGRAGFRLDLPD